LVCLLVLIVGHVFVTALPENPGFDDDQIPQDIFEYAKHLHHVFPSITKDDAIKFAEFAYAHANESLHNDPSTTVVPLFNCPPFTCSFSPSPSTVNELRMCDFSIIGALGDSITAAFGAKSLTLLTIFREYRGISWSVGGDKTANTGVSTLANFLKLYNSSLSGYSTGTGDANSNNAGLNVAVSGAVASDMKNQAVSIVNKIKKLSAWETRWKLITIFIGGNDLCVVCDSPATHDATAWRNGVDDALKYLSEQLPRTFINLVSPIDVTELGDVNSALSCAVLHPFECSCSTASQDKRKYTSEQCKKMAVEARLLALKPEYNRNDFAVVVQPFMEHAIIPRKSNGEPDLSYFAPDCFHFSEKGHQSAALALWNNMNQRVSEKDTEWDVAKDSFYICPTDKTTVSTNQNSL